MSSNSGITQNPVQSFGGLNSGLTSSVAGKGAANIIDVAAATATLVISPSQSGSTFLLGPTVALAISLPVVGAAQGCQFTFIQKTANPGADWTCTPLTAASLNGIVNGANTLIACVNATSLASATANAKIGDRTILTCTGTKWIVDAQGQTAACYAVA